MTGQAKLAVVFGGSGFVGRHVVRALAQAGFRVRVAARRPDLAGHLQPMGDPGQIQLAHANLRNKESVDRASRGADVVVNLVGLLAQSGKQRFKSVHLNGAKLVAEAAKKAGASQLIHVSAIGANRRC